MDGLSETDKAKFREARALIGKKRYDEARAILIAIDHTQATNWILRIDSIHSSNEQVESSERAASFRNWVIVAVIMIGIAVGIVYAIQNKQEADALRSKQAACAMIYLVHSEAWQHCVDEP